MKNPKPRRNMATETGAPAPIITAIHLSISPSCFQKRQIKNVSRAIRWQWKWIILCGCTHVCAHGSACMNMCTHASLCVHVCVCPPKVAGASSTEYSDAAHCRWPPHLPAGQRNRLHLPPGCLWLSLHLDCFLFLLLSL